MRKVWGEKYRSWVLCIDQYQDGVLRGRLYHPGTPHGESFRSLMELLVRMETLLDEMQFPQSFTAAREFELPARLSLRTGLDSELTVGALATFQVRILFRQNASWQGSVSWLDQQRQEHFRSALELVMLLHSALQPASAQEAEASLPFPARR